MKSKSIKSLTLIFLAIILFGINTFIVSAESQFSGIDPTNTSGGSASSGDHNNFQGFRFSVVNEDGSWVAAIDISMTKKGTGCNKEYRCNNNTLWGTNFNSKIEYMLGKQNKDGFVYDDVPSRVKYCNDLGMRCLGTYLSTGTSISDYFSTTSGGVQSPTSNLKKALSAAGYNCLTDFSGANCRSNQKILIEPIFDLKYGSYDYYGTIYEMAKKFDLCPGVCTISYNAINSFRAGKSYTFGSKTISGGNGNNGSKDSRYDCWVPNSNAITNATTTTIGNGIIIYKVEDLCRTCTKTPKYTLTITKQDITNGKDSETGKYPTMKNIQFFAYTNPEHSNKAGECTTNNSGVCKITDLKDGTYYLTERNVPENYSFVSCSSGCTDKSSLIVKIEGANKSIVVNNKYTEPPPPTTMLIIRQRIFDKSTNKPKDDTDVSTDPVYKAFYGTTYTIKGADGTESSGWAPNAYGLMLGKAIMSPTLSSNKVFERFLTGSNPPVLKYQFLEALNSTSSRIAMYYNPFCVTNVTSSDTEDLTYSIEFKGSDAAIPYGIRVGTDKGGKAVEKELTKKVGQNVYTADFTVPKKSKDVYILIKNEAKTGCVADFDREAAKGAVPMSKRIEIYQYYLTHPDSDGKTHDYNLLLYTKKTTGKAACATDSCTAAPSTSCLSTTIKHTFGENDLHCYTDTLVSTTPGSTDEVVGYCMTSLQFEPQVVMNPIAGETNFSGEKGTKFINSSYDDGTAAIATITKDCYLKSELEKSKFKQPEKANLKGYLSNEKFLYKNSEYKTNKKDYNENIDNYIEASSDSFEVSPSSGKSSHYVYTYTEKYRFPEIYYNLIDGSVVRSFEGLSVIDSKLRPEGRGVASRYIDASSGKIKFKLKYEVGEHDITKISELVDFDCTYTLDDRNPADIEFRAVDSTSPFPGKAFTELKSRKVGSNWQSQKIKSSCETVLEQFNSKKIKKIDYDRGESACDLNNDTYLDKEDYNIYHYAKNLPESYQNGSKKGDNNYLVSYLMERNDSYNKTGEGAKYTIYLDADTMKYVKEYNKTNKYGDNNSLKCVAGINCKSTFLDTLASKKSSTTNNSVLNMDDRDEKELIDYVYTGVETSDSPDAVIGAGSKGRKITVESTLSSGGFVSGYNNYLYGSCTAKLTDTGEDISSQIVYTIKKNENVVSHSLAYNFKTAGSYAVYCGVDGESKSTVFTVYKAGDDQDGDGFTNKEEKDASTDFRNASSHPPTVSPTITLKGNNPYTINYGDSYSEPGYTITKDPHISGDLEPTITNSKKKNHQYTITYTVTDKYGGSATAKRTVKEGYPTKDKISYTFNSSSNPLAGSYKIYNLSNNVSGIDLICGGSSLSFSKDGSDYKVDLKNISLEHGDNSCKFKFKDNKGFYYTCPITINLNKWWFNDRHVDTSKCYDQMTVS